MAPAAGTAVTKDAIELGAAGEAPTGPSASGGALARGGHRYGVSRLRPLARLRLRMSRPARVLMRLRKPCARARLRFLGW